MMACAREEIIVSEISVQDTPIGMQAQKGRLRLKFKSRFAGIYPCRNRRYPDRIYETVISLCREI